MRLYQTKNSCIIKEKNQQNKKKTMEWEKIFANHTCDKGSISKYIKNLYNKISKKIKQPD